MTQAQISQAKKLIGKMDRKDIAKTVGVSLSNLRRSLRGTSLAFHIKWKINQDLVKKVCAYYGKHGKLKTKEKFPDICLRSIVERYKYFKPRQVRLTEEQFIELAKMGGLISLKGQAKYFNRPRANEGSIKSLMYKKFGHGLVNLNGLHFNRAKYFCPIDWASRAHGRAAPVGLHCPNVVSKYWWIKKSKGHGPCNIYLWVDIEKNMREELPQFMRDAVNACANYQRWIWKCNNPRPKILKMIRDREVK